jgi:hypothetical protein
MLKKHIKKYAPIKEHRIKRVKHDPLQNKGKRRISKQGVFRKTKNIPCTCTSRSSCMTSFFLDLVFGSTTSCGTSVSLLSYPKLHIQAIEVGS